MRADRVSLLERYPDGARGGSLSSLVTHMIRLPMLVIVCGMEIFARAIGGLQRIADQSVDALTDPVGALPLAAAAAPANSLSHPSSLGSPPAGPTDGQPQDGRKEQMKMPDTNLNDDMLKLVRYKVLFIKRDYEVAFPEQEELVHDNMTDSAFTAWKVAEFIQALPSTPIPNKWKNKGYPRRDPGEKIPEDGQIHRLPEDDKKYLRVYFEVLQRYVREKFKHDEREVEELEKIRMILDERLEATSGGPTTPGPKQKPA